MQTLTLEGYLAADPSILSAQGSGKKRASFRVLETTRFRRADGTLSTMQNNWFGRMDWLRQLEPETARKAAPAPAK